MAKRRISKASKRRLTVFGSLSIVVVIYFSFSLIYNIYTIFSLNMEKKNLENKYVQLQEEADNLKSEISKLNDENYLANYAREHYLYSKNGEYILKIEDDINESLDTVNKEINKNYVIIFLSFVMLLIFIYILRKGKKQSKKQKK